MVLNKRRRREAKQKRDCVDEFSFVEILSILKVTKFINLSYSSSSKKKNLLNRKKSQCTTHLMTESIHKKVNKDFFFFGTTLDHCYEMFSFLLK